nr:uncharacterized protein LOC112292029 isoform X2 [Physcomitrium patens]|eukprot:XP_024395879.1 uncharacterized protein LOC112292029 isoform X2 [Physcomitrella patens]
MVSSRPSMKAAQSYCFWGRFLLPCKTAPLLLVPLFLTDSQGRRWIGAKIGLCIFGFGFTTILGVLTTTNWRVVAPYVGMSLEALQSAFNVAKELPGDLAEWLDSGKGFYLLIKTFVAFAVVALLCGSAFPMLQRRFNSLKVRIKGTDASLEPRSVNREEIAASRSRQQLELQEKAREKDELLRQRRVARIAQEEQRLRSKAHPINSSMHYLISMLSVRYSWTIAVYAVAHYIIAFLVYIYATLFVQAITPFLTCFT